MIAFAAARGYTAGDAALARVRAPAGPAGHSAVTAPIVGISRMEQLEENLKGWAWEMTPEERAEVGGFSPTEVWEETGGKFPAWRRSYEIA